MSETVLPTTAAPPPAGRRGRVLGWMLVGLLVLAVGMFSLLVMARAPDRHPAMDPEGPAASGTMALAEILRAQGVEITVVRTRTAAVSALRGDSTLVFAHPPALSDEAVRRLVDAADHTVIVTASARLLRLFDLGRDALLAAEPVASGCDWPPFSRVGKILPTRMFVPAAGVTGCFADTEGGAAVLLDQRGGRTLALLDGSALLANEHLAEDGNAALGLALLGQTGHVVWYVPSLADSDLERGSSDTLGSLTPDWVTPAIVLLMLAGLAAAIWRGRRFGPLVEETLPVTVRASETMQGRAHLTARTGDAAHAAAALRAGSVARLAGRLGLPARATIGEVADAAADRLRTPRIDLRDLLEGPLPRTDPELIDFARLLGDLEEAVENRVHTERSTP